MPSHGVTMLGTCRPVDTYKKICRIGEGTYGTVYSATDKLAADKERSTVALKRVILHNEKTDGFPVTTLREISTLRAVSGHPNCVRLLEVAVNSERDGVFLVFEYCEHDLSNLLDHTPNAFSESEVKTLTLQLLSALAHLHRHWIVHRDVKMSNLLYNNRGELKLADFGLARTFFLERQQGVQGFESRTAPMTPVVVTLWYRAPELLLRPRRADASISASREMRSRERRGRHPTGTTLPDGVSFQASTYGAAIDVWAAGCVAAELLRGGAPLLPGNGEIDQIHRIFELLGYPNESIWPGVSKLPLVESGDVSIRGSDHLFSNMALALPKTISLCGVELLQLCLAYDPNKRITASEAQEHPYFDTSPFPKESFLMPTFPTLHNSGGGASRKDSPDTFQDRGGGATGSSAGAQKNRNSNSSSVGHRPTKKPRMFDGNKF